MDGVTKGAALMNKSSDNYPATRKRGGRCLDRPRRVEVEAMLEPVRVKVALGIPVVLRERRVIQVHSLEQGSQMSGSKQ